MTDDFNDLTGAVAREIAALHLFLEQWFNGTLSDSDDVFAAGLERRLVPGFVYIQPAGLVLLRADLIEQIRPRHGASPEFRIRVAEIALQDSVGTGPLILATYHEYQRGARNSAADNARLSSVLLRREGADFRWLHIHETWLPAEALPADAFRF